MEVFTGRRFTWIHVAAVFMTVIVSSTPASADTFPVRKYEDGTIAIVSNHTQITGSRTAFRGDVWLSKMNGGKGGYLIDTIKNTRKLNTTLVSIKAQLRPVGCVENNTKSALFNYTTNEYFSCTCKTGWMGQDCSLIAPSPPPPPPSPPPSPPPTSPLACAFSFKPGEHGCNAGNINNGKGMCECCVYTPWSWRSCSNDCGCACDADETYSADKGICI